MMPDSEPMLAQAEPLAGSGHRLARAARLAPSFRGWAGLADPPEAARTAVARLRETIGAPAGAGVHLQASHMGLAAAGVHVEFLHEGGASVMLAGRPRWRGGKQCEPGELAWHVLDGYRSVGPRVLESLAGTFSLVLCDADGREALLAIDRMGVSPLVYARVGNGVVFGSSVQAVVACLGQRREIDLQSVFNYLFLHCVPGPATIVAGTQRLMPGGYVHLRDGRVDAGRYWKPRYDEASTYDVTELAVEFRRLLEQGLARALSGGEAGAFLSGGTDSSTVAGMLTRLLGKGARTYSIGFEAAGYDEMSYARIAARHFATDHHEYYVTPGDVLAVTKEVAAFCDQPFGNASAVPAYYCAKLAAGDGVDVLLGGDGGDELFGGNERYATQAMLSWYERVPSPIRSRLIEPLLFAIPAGDRMSLVRKGRGYVTQSRLSVPERLHAYNMLRRNDVSEVFEPDFLAAVDPGAPLAGLSAVYDGADAQGQLNRMLALDLQFTLADNDLYKVSRMCEFAGVDVAYPMLDDDLVAFSLRLPARLKLNGTRLRYFFKEALRDFLPAEIIAKRKHGFGLPVGLWTLSHAPLQALVYDGIRALASRGVVRPAFVERIIREHQAGHAAYWGGEIWVLSQLEFWLAQHGFASGLALR